jgi:HAD superfamily hydrolase (TIGR01509 family)
LCIILAMATSAIEAVVFDLDGLLLDSEQVWDGVREELARERGGRWHDRAQRDMMGMSSPEWSRYMHERIGLLESPEEISAEVVRRMLERYREHLPLLPGAVEAVERIAARWPLGLASSSNRPLIELALEQAGIAGRFRVVLSSEEVGRGKPAPDVYLEAARRLGADPGRCAAVEDSHNGILAARAAGMRVIAVPNSHFPPRHEALAAADAVLGSLEELQPAVIDPDGAGLQRRPRSS